MDFNNQRTKEELYSQAIKAGKRRYYFDVKETKGGDQFITITESRKIFDNATGNFSFDKNKLFLYKEDFEKFQHGLANALHFISTGEVPEPVEDDAFADERHESENDFDLSGSAPLDDFKF